MTSNRLHAKGFLTILTTLFLLLTSGCGEQKQIKGKEFVPRDVMVDMMIEIHLLDGITNDVKYYRRYNPQDSIDLYGSVYEKYNTDRDAFDLTILEYSKFPKLMDELYDEILMELNMMQDLLDKEVAEEKKEKDKQRKEALQLKENEKPIERPRPKPASER